MNEENDDLKDLLEQYGEKEGIDQATKKNITDTINQHKHSGSSQEINVSAGSEEAKDIRAQIQGMTVPQKIKLAMFGDKICRGLLVQDASKIIQACVMKNPQLQPMEVEEFIKNPNSSDFVIREIAKNKQWMKVYLMKLYLVMNPKTPQDISLKWLRYLRKSDLKNIARSKSIPSILSTSAKKMLAQSGGKGA